MFRGYFWAVSNVNPFSLIAWYSWRDHVHQEDFQIGQFAQILESSYHYKTFMWIYLKVLHGTQLKVWAWLEYYNRAYLQLQTGDNMEFMDSSDWGRGNPTPSKSSKLSTPDNSLPLSLPPAEKDLTCRVPNILLGQHWKSNMEFYDYQKVNGLPLPRVIRSSVWSQNKNILGFDPLTLPLSHSLHHGSENFWLRILASGKEVYLAPMGELSQCVFVNEILAELRIRGIDLTQVAQDKAVHDGLTLDNPAAIQHFAQIMAGQLQSWIPDYHSDVQSQAKIAALQAELATLKANTIPTPILCHGSIYYTWFQTLTLEGTLLGTIKKNIAAAEKWWQRQPDDAATSIHRVAVCSGVPPGKITSSQNENLLRILMVAVTMTSWLSNLLKTSKNMTQIASALALCKHQIGILASLSFLTLSSSRTFSSPTGSFKHV